MANGNPPPKRVLTGQATRMARTAHQISLDPVHDELVVPNPFAEAILFFRAGADGNEEPIRILQGPKTMLRWTDNVTVDPVYDEVYTTQRLANAIFVFRRDANGDEAPIRILQGPKTQLSTPKIVKVDSVNDVMVVTNTEAPRGFLIFRRTDKGNVAPRAIISGPRSGTSQSAVKRFKLYPEGQKIIGIMAGEREGEEGGFVGVWKYSDNGDVRPWAVLRASSKTQLVSPKAVALNPERNELYVDSGADPPGVMTYHLPELFR